MQGNYVRIVGSVKRNAEAESVREGLRALNFTVEAPTDSDRPTYVDCIAYGDVVESIEGFVEAGEPIEVEGFLMFRTYTDGRGRKKSSLYVMAESITTEE